MGKRAGRPRYKPYSVGEYRLNWYVDQFAAVWDQEGRRRRHRLGVTTEDAARRGLNAFARSHAAITAAEQAQSQHTIAGLFERYCADRELEGKQVYRVRWTWSIIGPVFGPLRPDDINKMVCRQHAAERAALGRSAHTVHGELRLLRTVLNWSAKARFIDRSPSVWLPPFPPARDRHLMREEIEALLAAAELPHVRLFIILAIATAARRSALLELTWSRVDFERGLIHLHDPDRARTNKGRAIVPLNDTARAALLEAKSGAMSDYVIEWAGAPVKSVRRSLDGALKRAGLKAKGDGAHLLRHSAAVMMAEAGVPMSEISQYLGHSSTVVTEKIYARYSPHYLKKAAATLNLDTVQIQAGARRFSEPQRSRKSHLSV
jgi:integrase